MRYSVDLPICTNFFAFSDQTLSVGSQEGHLDLKKILLHRHPKISLGNSLWISETVIFENPDALYDCQLMCECTMLFFIIYE